LSSAIEEILKRAVLWTVWGLLAAPAGLLIPAVGQDDLLWASLLHLSLVVSLGLFASWDLSGRLDQIWIRDPATIGSRFAAAAVVVALSTGIVALVTLASSAALRLDPSLQFLQLLSALDIAWVTSATSIGVGWMAGRRAGRFAGLMVLIACVWSIWSYLDVVGFSSTGGWLVDGDALRRYVLPYDVAAAAIAIGSTWLGARRRAGDLQVSAG